MYGEKVRIGHGSKGGWDMFGPDRTVTRAEGNILYELDGKPALELYKEYLGDRAEGLPATGLLFPLAIRENEEDEKRLVRTILAVDEETQSMTFAGDIPEGWLAHLMKANFDRLVDGASGAANSAQSLVQNTFPTLSIAISCVGRRLLLGERSTLCAAALQRLLRLAHASRGFLERTAGAWRERLAVRPVLEGLLKRFGLRA